MTMIPSCDGDSPLAGRLEDLELTGDRTMDKCAQCRRQQDRWCSYPDAQGCQTTRGTVPTRMSSRTVYLWTLVMVMTFCSGVRAAPEAFNRRQGDTNILIPPAGLHDLEDLGLAENAEQDAKHREEMAALVELIQQYQKEWQQQQQQQGVEEDPNRQDSAVPPLPEGYPNLPIPMVVQTKFFRSQDGVNKDEAKRGSYQPPLCYFKICNMGRKRNLR